MVMRETNISVPIQGYRLDGCETRMFDYVKNTKGEECIVVKERGRMKRIEMNDLETQIDHAREQVNTK